jgi:hypothetical protein
MASASTVKPQGSTTPFSDRWRNKDDFVRGKPVKERPEMVQDMHEDAYWQTHNARYRKNFMPIIARTDWSWQTDTMYYPLNGKLRAIFCAIEMTRKLGFCRVYKSSINATECVRFLDELKETYEVKFVGADPGVEYKNGKVESWADDNDVELYFYETKDSRSKGIVERFNLTVRRLLNWYTYSRNANWLAALPDVIESEYNTKRHSAIKMAPNAVTDADVPRLLGEKQSKGQAYTQELSTYAPGDRVRILSKVDPKNTEAYRKLGATWSADVYVVEKVDGYKVKLEGIRKRFALSELQRVKEVVGEAVPTMMSEAARKRKLRRERRLAVIGAQVDDEAAAAPRPVRRRRKKRFEGYVTDDSS